MPENLKNLRRTVPLADGRSVEAVYYGSGTLCLSTQAEGGCGTLVLQQVDAPFFPLAPEVP